MSKKVYYRHAETGDLGYLSEDGKNIILDRPLEQIEQPFKEGLWKLDKERRPLNKTQLAMIAYKADAELCRALNQKQVNPGEWLNLTDRERIAWVEGGPRKGIRRRLYEYVMAGLEPLGEP